MLSWAFKLGEVKPPIPPCTRDGVTSAGGYAPATSTAGSAPHGDSPRHSPSPCSYAQPSPWARAPPRRRTRAGARLAADPSDPPDPWYPRALAAKRVPMDPGIGAGAPLSHAPLNWCYLASGVGSLSRAATCAISEPYELRSGWLTARWPIACDVDGSSSGGACGAAAATAAAAPS